MFVVFDNCKGSFYNIKVKQIKNPWGYSAAGSASASHAEGRGFESPYLHHNILLKEADCKCSRLLLFCARLLRPFIKVQVIYV